MWDSGTNGLQRGMLMENGDVEREKERREEEKRGDKGGGGGERRGRNAHEV